MIVRATRATPLALSAVWIWTTSLSGNVGKDWRARLVRSMSTTVLPTLASTEVAAEMKLALLSALAHLAGLARGVSMMSATAILTLARTMPNVSTSSKTTSVSVPRAPMARDARQHLRDALDRLA